jgi:hypothetical protein
MKHDMETNSEGGVSGAAEWRRYVEGKGDLKGKPGTSNSLVLLVARSKRKGRKRIIEVGRS